MRVRKTTLSSEKGTKLVALRTRMVTLKYLTKEELKMSVMNKLMNTKLNKKGFTLAELLIVVAIIAVLVAVSIPIFTSQLNNAKLAADAANVRAKYAELVVAALEADSSSATITVTELQAACTNGSTVTKSSDDKYIEVTLSGASKSPVKIEIGAGNTVS